MLTILYPAGLLQDFSNNLAFYKVNKAGGTIYICQHVLCLNCKIVAGLFQNFVAGLLQDCLSSLKYSSYVIFTLIFTCAMPELQDCCRITSEFCSRIVARLLVLTQIQFICNIYSYFHMWYAWVARFLQDCSKIVSTHSNTIHV